MASGLSLTVLHQLFDNLPPPLQAEVQRSELHTLLFRQVSQQEEWVRACGQNLSLVARVVSSCSEEGEGSGLYRLFLQALDLDDTPEEGSREIVRLLAPFLEGIERGELQTLLRDLGNIPACKRSQVVRFAMEFAEKVPNLEDRREFLTLLCVNLYGSSEVGVEQMLQLVAALMQGASDAKGCLTCLNQVVRLLGPEGVVEREQIVHFTMQLIQDRRDDGTDPYFFTLQRVSEALRYVKAKDREQVLELALKCMQGVENVRGCFKILMHIVGIPAGNRQKVMHWALVQMKGEADEETRVGLLERASYILERYPIDQQTPRMTEVMGLLIYIPHVIYIPAAKMSSLILMVEHLLNDGIQVQTLAPTMHYITFLYLRREDRYRIEFEVASPEVCAMLKEVLTSITEAPCARVLAELIINHGEEILWNEENTQLIQTAGLVEILTREDKLDNPLNLYTSYQLLQRAAPLMHTPRQGVVGSQCVRFNPVTLQEMANRCILAQDLPPGDPTETLAALHMHLMQQDRESLLEQLETLGLTLQDVEGLASPYIQSLMCPYSSPEQVIPVEIADDVVAWRSILRYVASLDASSQSPRTLSSRALKFIEVILFVHACKTGRQEGITRYYNERVDFAYKCSLLSQAEEEHVANIHRCLWEVYRSEVNKALTTHSPLMRALTATADDEEEIEQLDHQARRAKNLVGEFLALGACMHFDFHAHLIAPALADRSAEEILEIIDRHLTPQWFTSIVQQRLNQYVSDKKIGMTGLSDLVGYREEYWVWNEEGDTPLALTEAGACALLINKGYFQRLVPMCRVQYNADPGAHLEALLIHNTVTGVKRATRLWQVEGTVDLWALDLSVEEAQSCCAHEYVLVRADGTRLRINPIVLDLVPKTVDPDDESPVEDGDFGSEDGNEVLEQMMDAL